MAQVKPEYSQIKEFRDIAIELVKKYPEQLDGIDTSALTCVAVTNKEPKEGKPLWELKPVPYPMRLDIPFDYYVVVNSQDWDGMDRKHQTVLVMDVLCSIDKSEPGKTVPFDLKDHAVMVRTLGVDYQINPDIPDILSDNIQWKTNNKD